MSTTYTKSLSTDFGGNLKPEQLHTEIEDNTTITTSLTGIELVQDDVNITFVSTLSAPEQTELDTVIAAHTPVIYIQGETFDAIVDVTGRGDYLLPSAAFAAGHKSIYLRNGVYFETTDVIVPNYGTLVGESGGNVIIHFMGLANGVVADGSGGVKENTGTIAATNSDNTIVGTGTTFTNLSPDDFILIKTNFYTIASITDDTHLELTDTYRGVNISGVSYFAQTMHTGITMTKLIIIGSATYGLYIRACWHFSLNYVALKANTPNLYITDSGDSACTQLILEYGVGSGVTISNCASLSFNTMDIYNNTVHGIYMTDFIESAIFASCEASNNGGSGIYMTDAVDIGITDCVIKTNTVDGVYVGLNSINTTISTVTARLNGGYGIQVKGDMTVLTSNICNNNNIGICVSCDDCIVNGNIVNNNTVDGIKIDTGSTDNIVVNNNLKNNATALNDLGTGTSSANNKV